jgi:hypothetical protein
MRAAVLLSVLASVAMPQSQPAPSSLSSIAGGSISGVVRDAGTGTPMPDVEVGAFRPSARAAMGTTDTQGRYTLRALESGSYRVSAMSRASNGVGLGSMASRTVTLQAGQELTGIDIRLPPQCEISGKVVDENDEPLAGITVFLVAREYSSGTLRLVFASASTTDDQGKYTLRVRVEAGRAYLLLAQKRQRQLPAISEAPDDPKLRKRVPVPTYYPDAKTPEGAQAVVLRVGERRENVDIRILKTPSYCIEGLLGGPNGPADLNFQMTIQQPTSGASGSGAFYTVSPGGRLGQDGRIRICDLHPGDYELSVMKWPASGRGAPELFDSTTLMIADRDLVNVRLAARPGSPVAGEVAWEGAAPEKPVEAVITMDLRSMTRTVYPTGKSSLPGQFSFPGLLQDEYSIQTRGLPDGLYVKDVTYGGQSVLGKALRVGSAMGDAGLRVVVARDGGSVSARVTDKDGKPVGDCSVMLLPAGASSEAALATAMQSGQTDQNGAWTSSTLAPGRYFALASYASIDRSPETIGKLWRARSRAKEIALEPNMTAQVTLEPREIE